MLFRSSGVFDLRPLVATSVNEPLGLDSAAAASSSPMLHLPRGPEGRPGVVVAWGDGDTDAFAAQSRHYELFLSSVLGPAADFSWNTTAEFYAAVEKAGPSLNVAPLAPHGVLRFAAEPLQEACVVRVAVVEDLDGDAPAELAILGQVDGRHPARAKARDDQIGRAHV